MARLDKYRYPWPWRDRLEKSMKDLTKSRPVEDLRKEMESEGAAFSALRKKSESLKGDAVVGAIMSWPRGDGCAYYIVTNEKPLTLQWIPYGDAWTVEAALIRGTTKEDILAVRRQDKKLRELFQGRKFKR